MKNKITKAFISITASACTKIASTVSASACSWGSYQPEEPKCLKK